MATAAAGNDAAVKGGGKKKLIIIIAIVLVVVLAGVAGFLGLQHTVNLLVQSKAKAARLLTPAVPARCASY